MRISSFLLSWAALALCVASTAQGFPPADPQFPRVISGRVTDVDGQPVPGALVEWGYFRDPAEQRESVKTDSDGHYRIETSNVGLDFRLGVSKSGFAPRWKDRLIPGPSTAPTQHDVTLNAGITLAVEVKSESGAPLAGVDVTPQTAGYGFHSSFSTPVEPTPLPGVRTVTTDSQGRVTLSDLPPNADKADFREGSPEWKRTPALRIHLQIKSGEDWSYGQAISQDDLSSSSPIAVLVPDYVLLQAKDQAGIVRGRVIDNETQAPITDYVLTVRYSPDAHPIQNAAGEFRIEDNIRSGREYEVRIFAPAYAVAVMRIKAAAAKAADPQRIVLERQPSLVGRLVDDATGEPLARVQVVTGTAAPDSFKYIEWSTLDQHADGHHGLHNVLRVTTDDDGKFVVPQGVDQPATLIVLTPEYGRVVIQPEQRPQADADGAHEIRLQRAASATAIALRDTQLGGIANAASLSFISNDGFEHMYHATPLDAEGRLRFDSLAAGEYRLALYLSRRGMSYPVYSTSFRLEAGEHKDVPLGAMSGPLRLSGTARPFSMVRVAPVDANERTVAVEANVDGKFELLGLEAGDYRVSTASHSASIGFYPDRAWKNVNVTEDVEVDLLAPTP